MKSESEFGGFYFLALKQLYAVVLKLTLSRYTDLKYTDTLF